MNKLFAILGCMLLTCAFSANAATFNLDLTMGTTHFGNTLESKGAFSDDYTINVPFDIAKGAAHISNAIIQGTNTGKIEGFKATLDGQAFVFEQDNSTQELHLDSLQSILSIGLHHLIVSGTGLDIGDSVKSVSYSGNIVIAQTPIPAAVWLFGSALIGLIGKRRSKAVLI